jgi:hypothetical protein
MPKALFPAEEFTPTEFSTAQDKAAFGNHFFRFIESDWKQTIFTKTFYNRLSNCFGHIAHYDLHGFYGVWFAHDERRLNFLQHTLRFSCYGDPGYTFSDVERAIKAELRRRPLVAQHEARVAAAIRAQELAQLKRLQAKYGALPTAPASPPPAVDRYSSPALPPGQAQPRATQISLF